MREYTKRLHIKLRDGEKEMIRKRMEEAGIKNMSAYIRKIMIDGLIVRLELKEMPDVLVHARIVAELTNQMAKRANTTGEIYLEDIKDLNNHLDEMIRLLKQCNDSLAVLSKHYDSKIGSD